MFRRAITSRRLAPGLASTLVVAGWYGHWNALECPSGRATAAAAPAAFQRTLEGGSDVDRRHAGF
jgi:hypothetical protein